MLTRSRRSFAALLSTAAVGSTLTVGSVVGVAATATPAAADHIISHAAPNVRVVDHPRITKFSETNSSPAAPWLYEGRLDVLWDPRTTPGCQATGRIQYSRDGMNTWNTLTDWTTKRESDGNLTLRIIGTIFPGPGHYVMQWTLDCPANAFSGQQPYRRTLANGIIHYFVGQSSGAPAPSPVGSTATWGGYGGGGTWGATAGQPKPCSGLICPTNSDGSCNAIICFRL